MPYIIAFRCVNCGNPGSGHPERVMSIPASWNVEANQYLPDTTGERMPVCRSCAERALERIHRGEVEHVSSPLYRPNYLEWAYGEWMDEDE